MSRACLTIASDLQLAGTQLAASPRERSRRAAVAQQRDSKIDRDRAWAGPAGDVDARAPPPAGTRTTATSTRAAAAAGRLSATGAFEARALDRLPRGRVHTYSPGCQVAL